MRKNWAALALTGMLCLTTFAGTQTVSAETADSAKQDVYKRQMETLLDGGNITVNIDEQIVFDQLEQNEDAVWSLLLAGGYLKVENLNNIARLNREFLKAKLAD